jgi:hypothetical protein
VPAEAWRKKHRYTLTRALLATFEPHRRTDFLRSLETSGQRKLFRVSRQDDNRICTHSDLIIRDAAFYSGKNEAAAKAKGVKRVWHSKGAR